MLSKSCQWIAAILRQSGLPLIEICIPIYAGCPVGEYTLYMADVYADDNENNCKQKLESIHCTWKVWSDNNKNVEHKCQHANCWNRDKFDKSVWLGHPVHQHVQDEAFVDCEKLSMVQHCIKWMWFPMLFFSHHWKGSWQLVEDAL